MHAKSKISVVLLTVSYRLQYVPGSFGQQNVGNY